MEQNEGKGGEVRHPCDSDCDSNVISAAITSVNPGCSHFHAEELILGVMSPRSRGKGQRRDAGSVRVVTPDSRFAHVVRRAHLHSGSLSLAGTAL